MNKPLILVVEDDPPVRNLIIAIWSRLMVKLPFWKLPPIIRISYCLTLDCRIWTAYR